MAPPLANVSASGIATLVCPITTVSKSPAICAPVFTATKADADALL
jgi:hypothetical protein